MINQPFFCPSFLQLILHPWPKHFFNLTDASRQKRFIESGELNYIDFSHVLIAKFQPKAARQKSTRNKRETKSSSIPVHRYTRKKKDKNVLMNPPKNQGYIVRQPQHCNYWTSALALGPPLSVLHVMCRYIIACRCLALALSAAIRFTMKNSASYFIVLRDSLYRELRSSTRRS